MSDIASKIRDMEEAEQKVKRPVSPNLDVSNILYDHYMGAALSGLLGNPSIDLDFIDGIVEHSHQLALAAIKRRNKK